jgi:hypothetical protein
MGQVIKLSDHIETKTLKKELNELSGAIDDLAKKFVGIIDATKNLQAETAKGNTTQSETVKKIKDVNKSVEELTASEKEIQKIQKQTIDIQAKISTANSKEAKELETLKKQYSDQKKGIKDVSGSYNDLDAQLKKATKDYKDLSKAQREGSEGKALQSKISGLDKELKNLDSSMGKHNRNVGNYESALEGLPGGFGAASKGAIGLGKQLWALVANPIGAIIAAIVLYLAALYKAFTSTDSGANMFAAGMEIVSAVIDVVRQRLAGVATGIVELFKGNWKESMAAFKEGFRGIGDQMTDATKAAVDYTYAIDALGDSEDNYISKRADNANKIAKLEFIVADKGEGTKKRREALDAALAMSKEESEHNKLMAEKNLQIELDYLAAKTDSRDKASAEEIKAFLLMSDEEQKNAKSSLKLVRNNNEAKFKELEELYAKSIDADTAYFEENKKLNSKKAQFEADIKAEELASEKKLADDTKAINDEKTATQKQQLDNWLKIKEQKAQEEINIETEKLLKGEITNEQYAKRIIEIQIAATEAQLKNADLSAEQRLAIETKLLGAKKSLLDIDVKQTKDAENTKIIDLKEALLGGTINQQEYDSLALQSKADFLQQQLDLVKGNAEKEKEIGEELLDVKIQQMQKEKEEREKLQGALLSTAQMAFETQNVLLETESQNLEAQYQYRLELAGDNEAAKAKVEKDFDKKRKELKTKQAQADKNAAIFNAVISGAQAVVGMMAAVPGPAGIVLGVLVGILAAVQVASIASRPIPKFYKGLKDNPKDQFGIVGDAPGGGSARELIEYPSGQMELATTKQMKFIPKGANIYTNYETEKILAGHGGVSESKLNELVSEQRETRKAISNQTIHQTIVTEKGFEYATISGTQQIKWINKYMNR